MYMGCLEVCKVYIRCIYMYNTVYMGAYAAIKVYKVCITGI